MELFGHPFSSYTWKTQIAFHEKGIGYEFRMLGAEHAENGRRLYELWPAGKFPLIVDEGRAVFEASIIIEYLDHRFPDTQRMIPADFEAALEVRMFDRIFDNYVMGRMQEAVNDSLRPENERVPSILVNVKATLETVYGWLDKRLKGSEWATHCGFSMADCAAAPSLFYADWVHQISDAHPNLKAYRARLLARASIKQCVEAARPYRAYFPLGAPDRD